jgi:hypothetical protein
MFLFPNLDDEVNVYDKRQGNGFFSVTGTEPIICKYRKGDLLKVLLYEKPLLEGYKTIDITHVVLDNIIDNNYDNIKVWRIYISFTNGIILGGGSEIIENLEQKIRDIKLNKLLDEE